MSRKARHLQVLDDSKNIEYNSEQPSKKKSSLLEIIKDARDDEFKRQANLYATSLGKPAPNKLKYESETGGKRKAKSNRRKSIIRRRARKSRKNKKKVKYN